MSRNEGKPTVYERAIEKWGTSFQLKMVAEECAELIKAVLKFERKTNGSNIEGVIDEIIDVEIMIEQLKIMLSKYDINLDWLLKTAKRAKIDRLELRLKDD